MIHAETQKQHNFTTNDWNAKQPSSVNWELNTKYKHQTRRNGNGGNEEKKNYTKRNGGESMQVTGSARRLRVTL